MGKKQEMKILRGEISNHRRSAKIPSYQVIRAATEKLCTQPNRVQLVVQRLGISFDRQLGLHAHEKRAKEYVGPSVISIHRQYLL
jgi:hypothetical protein